MERTSKERGLQTWRGAEAGGAADVRPKPIRLLVVAPSHEYLGGQSVHASQLVKELRKEPDFRVGFASISPRVMGLGRRLHRMRYVRPLVRMPLYLANLLLKIPRHDVIHVSSAAVYLVLLSKPPTRRR